MNLTYEVKDGGYVILNDGVAWIVQESYIPFPAATLEESAQLHINDILAAQNTQPQNTLEEELQVMKEKQALMQQAIDDMILGGAL